MNLHQIIKNDEAFKHFIDWLPDLEDDECYYLHLQARKKYGKGLGITDKIQNLKRLTATKNTLYQKVKQLECPYGSYTTKQGDPIPNEVLTLYITVNPRNLYNALFSSAKSFVDMIQKKHTDKKMKVNPHIEAMSQIHKSKSRTCFVHFDIDHPTGEETDEDSPKSGLTTEHINAIINQVVGSEAFSIVETRGGCHVLIDPEKVVSERRDWHREIRAKIDCDQTGDMMLPVVGCTQGGFVPHFYR